MMGIFPVEGSAGVRLITPGPWAVDVQDVAWHPTERRWLAVAREVAPSDWESEYHGRFNPRDVPYTLYILDGYNMPEPVPNSQGTRAAYWAPGGESILAITAKQDLRWEAAEGNLVRISLDGTVEQIAEVYHAGRNFVANEWGAAATKSSGDLVYLDPQGELHTLNKPCAGWAPLDVYVAEDVVIAAYCPRHEKKGHRRREARAKICLYERGARNPIVIAECDWVRQHDEVSQILGWEPSQRAVVIYHAYGDVYVLRPEEPRVENLRRPRVLDWIEILRKW